MSAFSAEASALFEAIRFSHTVFALPFALVGAMLAARGWPSWGTLAGIVACAVTARSAAMGVNRLADERFDARNPRTASWPLPSGRLRRGTLRAFVGASALLFVGFAFALNPLCGTLAPFVLALLFGYAWTKRWTPLAHYALGGCLALAPLGAWLAVRGSFEGDLLPVLLLGGAVALWVAGFDLLYACADEAFDRREGLPSFPARFGVRRTLRLSSATHATSVLLLAAATALAGLGAPAWGGVAIVALLLVVEHRLARPDDLSRLNAAFFAVNGWISVGFFAAVLLDFAPWREA